jgi:hypothetical protein
LMHFNSEEYMFWEQGTQIFARRWDLLVHQHHI